MRPYQLSPEQLGQHLDQMVATTFGDLTSQFMLLPRGSSFLSYEEFRAGYEALRISTDGFERVDVDRCWVAARRNAVAIVALRAILGITGPEWQDIARELTGIDLPSNWARGLDRKVRIDPNYFSTRSGTSQLTVLRTTRLLEAAVATLVEGGADAPEGLLHRLDKIDTREGLESLRYVSLQNVPYAVLLYERYLGRPFASHRDAVSELVGDVMESAVEDQLASARIPFRKTRRAERVPGFDQAPDFFAPDELAPMVIIEAKITGDDGTARDKVARILRLAGMRDTREREGHRSFEVVACIDGRGFGVRKEDMAQLLLATRGKVFTAASLGDLIGYTSLKDLQPQG